MVEVDLRLFVTCRLCLDVQGHFQIDPSVREQIKYCFDIDIFMPCIHSSIFASENSDTCADLVADVIQKVQPFDGLPQLICKKCENILREHYAVKKNFTDKQKELQTKLPGNGRNLEKSPLPQTDDSDINKTKVNDISLSRLDDCDSSHIKDDYHEKNIKRKKRVKKKRIVNRLMSSDDEDVECNNTLETQIDPNPKKLANNGDFISWDTSFNKYFICRICSQGFQDKEEIKNHIKKHSTLQMKYKNIFKMSCLVVMKKSDNKPNMCNSNNAVVYSSDSIIQNNHNPFYYIKYYPKTYSDILKTFRSISKNNQSSSESTDSEIFTRKRRRLLSRSSSETVVINQHSEHKDASPITEENINSPTVIECIDLGDSSDNGSYESNAKGSITTNKEKLDSKPIQNIIKMCHNKYTKQLDSREKKISQHDKGKEDFLQHKVLSIGQKIINNNGFNCTGLLRFLEYKDLSVIWKETSVRNAKNDCKYVRIATKVRENDNGDNNNVKWKKINLFTFESEETFHSVNILKKLKTFSNFKKKSKVLSAATEKNIENSVEKLPPINAALGNTDLGITKIDSDNLMLKKLLNKNPVSNPKQLPKKINTNESHPKNMKVFSAPNTVPIASAKQIENYQEADTNIVTSTVSLAHLIDKEKNTLTNDSVDISNNQQTYPRIKVKPVSELMAETATTSINSTDTFVNGTQNASQISNVIWPNQNVMCNKQQTWHGQDNSAVIICNPIIRQNQNDSFIERQVWHNQNISLSEQHNTVSVNNASQCSKTSGSAVEYLVLDTVEFPNTKTNSPLQYFKNLLLVHNIILLNTNEPMPAGSVCLVKLKLVYQQEKCEPITLCLSLCCFKNVFCIQIKNMNQADVNINKLSANWQWQLLKIYNNDVITKVLQTASKISQETFKYTQEFFALLKSIKVK